jgi:hypothetical protein
MNKNQQSASFFGAACFFIIQTMKENFQYPDENIIPIFYKSIYKYESLDVKTLSDKQIKDYISNSSLVDFEKALAIIQKTGQCHNVRDNKAIYSMFNEYQGGKMPTSEFHFEKRTKKATFLNSLLFHLRNTLAHAGFKEEGNNYKIVDYDDMRLSAFGYIDKCVFMQFFVSFTK